MAEPTSVVYPTAYDSSSTLLGALKNQRPLTVAYAINTAATQVTVFGDASFIELPNYLVFEGGEIWFVESGGISQVAASEWLITITNPETQRAVKGSPLQPHKAGERVFVPLMGAHLNQLKKAFLAAQKYRFRVGTEATRGAVTPEVGERFLCMDSGKVYYCLSAGTWTWVNKTLHSQLDNLNADDHPQYTTAAEATAWHGTVPGSHIAAGDDHDHASTSQGAAVVKLASGLDSSKPTSPVVGQLYFSTDIEGGALYVCASAGVWERVAGVPSGAIAAFNGACPSGWTRYTALDARFPRGAATAGGSGGSAVHNHTYTDTVQHYHTFGSISLVLNGSGSHSHSVTVTTSSTGGDGNLSSSYGGGGEGVGSTGSHSHSVSIPSRTTNASGVEGATTTEDSGLPPYKEVVFCKKD